MLIFDLFSGTGSATQAFKDAGHTVITFEIDSKFNATEITDVMGLDAKTLLSKYGRPDFIWASPPCTAFSVAAISRNWISGGEKPIARRQESVLAMRLVERARDLIIELNPYFGYLIENPRGMLRKLEILQNLKLNTVTYCQYGDSRMKPTDLWGDVPGWSPRNMCKPGSECHISAPRGSNTGTQGLPNATERARIPYELGQELLMTLEKLDR